MIYKNLSVSESSLTYNFLQNPSIINSIKSWLSTWKSSPLFLISLMKIYNSILEQFYEFINLSITELNSFGRLYKSTNKSLNSLKMNSFLCLFYRKNKATKSSAVNWINSSAVITFFSQKLFFNINLCIEV